MPQQIDTVVVFGDSLSDIGRKWTTKAGKMARATGQMTVNETGRFSDCRNWCDYMVEAATGQSLVVHSAAGSIAASSMHLTLGAESGFACTNPFQYVNYAEGGACGDTPYSTGKRPFLSTFKEEVDWFEADLNTHMPVLGHTLFLVWFGANDLYTAGRPASEMPNVAREVAVNQRARLSQLVRGRGGTARFIFINLARPLTSVRYTNQITQVEAGLVAELGLTRPAASSPQGAGNLWYAKQALAQAAAQGRTGGRFTSVGRAIRNLEEKLAQIKEFEKGVMNYNVALAACAEQQRDRVAEIGCLLSEHSISRLILGNNGLTAGAMTGAAAHTAAVAYGPAARPVTTSDEVHPTDHMYKIIWGEIREEIRRADCTFGQLDGAVNVSTLAAAAGPDAFTRHGMGGVLNELLTRRPVLRPVTRARR